MAAWLDQRFEAIRICLDADFAEAALALLHSGIDTLSFLGAPVDAIFALSSLRSRCFISPNDVHGSIENARCERGA